MKGRGKGVSAADRPAASVRLGVFRAVPAEDVQGLRSLFLIYNRADLCGQHGNHHVKTGLIIRTYAGHVQFTPVQVIIVHKCPTDDGFCQPIVRHWRQDTFSLMSIGDRAPLCFRTGDWFLLLDFRLTFNGSIRYRHDDYRRLHAV